MRRLSLVATLSLLAMLVFASVAFAQSRGPSGADGTYNCEDFDTQEQAQAFFDADPSDPDGLDGPPGDAFTGEPGVACESLPSGGDDDTGVEPADNNGAGNMNAGTQQISCDDFISAAGNPSQFQAQQYFDFQATPQERAILDQDGDGFACDELETGVDNLGETDADRAATQDTGSNQYADNGADDNGMTELPDTGGPALLPIAALMMGFGAIGLGFLRLRQ